MAQVDVLRPNGISSVSNVTATGGTANAVLADNSDATYTSSDNASAAAILTLPTHTPPVNMQRHQVRVRLRASSNTGTKNIYATLQVGTDFTVSTVNQAITTTVAELTGAYASPASLATSSALSSFFYAYQGGTQEAGRRVNEAYVDVDCRLRPTYTPDVRDAAGVSRASGTVTDTNTPTLVFGGVAYDGLPDRAWSVTVGGQTFSGVGTPPSSLTTGGLANGAYSAIFRVSSTIRGADAFEHQQTITFNVDFDIPPPPPPANLTAEYTADGAVRLCWQDPGGQPWDNDFVYAEIFRSDCVDPDDLGLTVPGDGTSYAFTLDTSSLDVTGSADLAVELTHETWRPETPGQLVAKHLAAGNQRSYSLLLLASGELELGWSTNGTDAGRSVVTSTVALPFGRARRAVRGTLNVNNGSGQHEVAFYTADSIDGPWTQLGTTVVRAGTTSIFASTAQLETGVSLDAVIHRVQVRSGIGGTLVADPNFVDTLPEQTTLVDSTGKLWTLAGDSQLQAVPETRIAVVEDGLTACFTDYAVPVRYPADGCDTPSCPLSYRVRYVGTVSNVIVQPSNVPSGFIVGWPSTAGSIPSGWTRVTALDDLFPRGSAATVSGATGGTATHQHTTPEHTHAINAHSHTLGGSTGTSNVSTTSARFNGASQTQADQPHSHTRAANTGSGGSGTSGSTSPATDAANNLPAYRSVIWIASNGSPTAFTAGSLAYSAEDVALWSDDASSSGRQLRGAAAAGNGGTNAGADTHAHTVASHTHTGVTHNHTLANTGLSNPLSTQEAGTGTVDPRWLPRHTHPMTVGSSATGSTNASDGGPTGSATLEPPHRRLRVLANTGGGLSTRMIGLFRGDASLLPATMVRCDGSNGTPDMRDLFARERGADSLGTTGGALAHDHTTGNHSHTMPSHTHTTDVGTSQTGSFQAPTFGDLGDSPTTTHDHTSGGTGSFSPTTAVSTSGTTGSGSNVPPYEDVHFVRLEGVSTVTGVAVPQIIESAVAEITLEAPESTSDRLATDDGLLEICASSSYDLPRLQQRAVPIVGGLPQVSTTTHGRQRRLEFPVTDADVPAVEALLAESFIWYAPISETAAWYACGGWSVRPQVPGLKLVSVTLVEADPPALEDPENLL